MDKVLIRDLIIPAGTMFRKAPLKSEYFGDDHVEAVFGLTNNTSGHIHYCLDTDEKELRKWFRDLV